MIGKPAGPGYKDGILVRRGIATALIFAFSLAEAAQGEDRSEGLGLPGTADSARYSFSMSPAESGDPSMLRHHADGSLVLVRRASDTWSISGRASELDLSRSPVIPSIGLTVPSELWEIQAGGAFFRRLGGRRAWGVSAGIGSASDEPFRTIHETEVRATAFRQFPSRERNSWMLFLAYSNNRSFLNHVPFPGVAYVFREPVPGLQATVGLPFVSLSYQPGKDWRGSFSAFGPTNVSAEGARRLFSEAWAYARYERSPSQWLRAGRTERSDRLIFDRHEARVGVRSPVWNGFSMDLSGGREFRRRFYESRDASRSGAPKAELADAWAGALHLSWRRRSVP